MRSANNVMIIGCETELQFTTRPVKPIPKRLTPIAKREHQRKKIMI